MKLIENIVSKTVTPNKKAAMYYKTEPFYSDYSRYQHTNNWEIVKATEILTERGFSVDIIDRSNHDWRPTKKYDLFLGLGVGNSGANYAKYAEASQAKVKTLIAQGPEPHVINSLLTKRYEMFNERNKANVAYARMSSLTEQKFLDIMSQTDVILCIGEKDNFSYSTFQKFGKIIIPYYPGTSPKVMFDSAWKSSRRRNNFLCFTGNGLICKGVDLLVESFKETPELNLHICGPQEEDFFRYYSHLINKSNISFHGFIEPGGQAFNQLASICSYVVFHSACEGCCTSVATTLGAGLVPVINHRSGIKIEDIGFSIPEDDEGDVFESIKTTVKSASKIDDLEYERKLSGTLSKSKLFTQNAYIQSYSSAIDQMMEML